MSTYLSGNRHAVEFIHALSFGDLPDDVQIRAKTCLLDLIGACLGGCRAEGAEILLKFADSEMKSRPGLGHSLWPLSGNTNTALCRRAAMPPNYPKCWRHG